MGDSAITETFGIGGAAMIAAPGVTRFVGPVAWKRARADLKEMAEISLRAQYAVADPGCGFSGRVPGTGHSSRGRNRHYATHQYRYRPVKRRGSGRLAQALCGHRWRVFEQALEALAESMGIG